MNSTVERTLCSFKLRYRSSFTASASKAAWKNDAVCSHLKAGVTELRLIRRPVNMRLKGGGSEFTSGVS